MSTYPEDQLLPLSALQHLLFCERQCALIYLEQMWDDNRLTVEGRILHEKVHEREDERRGDVRIARGLRLRSLKLGLTGEADVVEFHRQPDGSWRPFPVEYKRGRPKPDICDEAQLCAQAMCLEEMLGLPVPEGAMFYGTARRRQIVAFNVSLRTRVAAAAERLHQLFANGITPPPVYEKRCKNCSLITLCRPRMPCEQGTVEHYLRRMLETE